MQTELTQVIEGIGFFHFVANNWKHPLGSLECELKKNLRGRNFLIVLPEAFNFGADYNGEAKTPKIPAERALRRLAHLSRKYGVVFVAGMLHAVERFNSAYLIDADLGVPPWRLLCHKRSDDHPADYPKLYELGPDELTNCRNPSHCKGVYIGALICNDAVSLSKDMERRLRECSGRTLLCVPAWISDRTALREETDGPPDPYYWVLANSHQSGYQSFIRRGKNLEQRGGDGQNALVVRTWDELDKATDKTYTTTS